MGDRMLSIIFIIIFILANAIFIFSKRAKNLAEFTLENRSLGTFKLFGTFLATNLSAFTIFGVSGSAYRIGWAFFPVMAFGTGFMAFSFILFGLPLRKLSLTNNWITPSDFISSRFNSIILGKIVSLLLLIFTLPYIAVQIGSLGSLLSSIVNLPKWICSLVFTAIIAGYILKGGLKSVVKTDIFQLFVLYTFAIVAIFLVFSIFKNEEAVKNIFSKVSEMADPIFPHLTQRFYSAKSDKVLIKSMILYPLACLIIFFSMTFLGIIGTAVFPNLPLNKTDTIFTMLLHKVSGIYAPIFSLAAIAAIMSTLDSQILTCSSMVANDFLIKNKLFNNTATQQKTSDLKNLEDLKNEKSLKITKLLIILISILSYIISLLPISSILSFLTNSAFNGYASLFIIYICALYFPRIEKSSSILTILIGFTLIIFQNLKIINFHLPFIFIILGFEAFMLIISNLIIKFLRQIKAKIPQMKYGQVNLVNENEKIINPYLTLKNIIPVIIIFLLGLNIIFYFLPLNLFLGLPLWVWYQIIVTILLSAVFYLLFERMEIDIENRTK